MREFHSYRKLSQSTIEYAVLIAVFCAAVILMFQYAKAGIRAKFKFLGDEMRGGMLEEFLCHPMLVVYVEGWTCDTGYFPVCNYTRHICLPDVYYNDWINGNVAILYSEWEKIGGSPFGAPGLSYRMFYKLPGDNCEITQQSVPCMGMQTIRICEPKNCSSTILNL